jgi:MerR family transcriptional regulator, heat shock protein HspR
MGKIMEKRPMKRQKGFYSISAVAKMFSIHQQTIRLYEKEGLLTPKRSDGNTRLFSEEDVDRLEQIIHLTHQMGVNLAGVEMVLKLQEKIDKMQKKMNAIFEATSKELKEEQEISKEAVKSSARALIKLKQTAQLEKHPAQQQAVEPQESTNENVNVDDWEIEFEE